MVALMVSRICDNSSRPPQIGGVAHEGDLGASIATGDINADGYDDVVVGLLRITTGPTSVIAKNTHVDP